MAAGRTGMRERVNKQGSERRVWGCVVRERES